MAEYAVLPLADYQDVCDAVREKTGSTETITSGQLGEQIRRIQTGVELPELVNAATDAEVFSGYEYIGGDGEKKTGVFTVEDEVNDQTDLIAQIKEELENKAAGSGSVQEVEQCTPEISVNSFGYITAAATQEEGYVKAGTKKAYHQLPVTYKAKITPGDVEVVAAKKGTFVLGDVTVAPIASSASTCSIIITTMNEATAINGLYCTCIDESTGLATSKYHDVSLNGHQSQSIEVICGTMIVVYLTGSNYYNCVVTADEGISWAEEGYLYGDDSVASAFGMFVNIKVFYAPNAAGVYALKFENPM